jgi:hypothetical protein
LVFPPVHQARDRVTQGIVAFADEDLAVQIQDDDVTDRALDDLHSVLPCCFKYLRGIAHATTRLPRLSMTLAETRRSGRRRRDRGG